MESVPPVPTGTEGDLAAAFAELRKAIELREAEHERRGRNRALFTRGVLVLFLGILVAFWMMAKTFDADVFKSSLGEKLSADTPRLVGDVRSAVTSLVPVYQKEVERTYPAFIEHLATAITDESGKLAETLTPLAKGETGSFTAEADGAFAHALLGAFPELKGDVGQARALATAIRAQQLLAAKTELQDDLPGPFATLLSIEKSLQGMGPPDKELMASGDFVDAMGNAALDLVKARLVSGEGFAFGNKKDGKKAAPKAATAEVK